MSESLSAALGELLGGLMASVQSDRIDQLIELDLSLSQARILLIMGQRPEPWPIHRIAEEVGLSLASAGRNIDRLVALDLLSRTENPEDRRVKLIDVTKTGRQAIAQHFAPKVAAVEAFAEALPAPVAADLEVAIRDALDTGALQRR